MQSKPSSSRLHRSCGIVARLGLILSLWQAPIPWLHSHGTDVSEITSPLFACDFCEHLRTFHSADELNSGEEYGWHCHWILPSWLHLSDEGGGGRVGHAEDPSAFDAVIPQPVPSSSIVAQGFAVTPLPGFSRRAELSERVARDPRRMSESFSRPHRSSVMRC